MLGRQSKRVGGISLAATELSSQVTKGWNWLSSSTTSLETQAPTPKVVSHQSQALPSSSTAASQLSLSMLGRQSSRVGGMSLAATTALLLLLSSQVTKGWNWLSSSTTSLDTQAPTPKVVSHQSQALPSSSTAASQLSLSMLGKQSNRVGGMSRTRGSSSLAITMLLLLPLLQVT